MINPICDLCKEELNRYGALLFSPPEDKKVIKTHICKECYCKLKEENKF